MHSEKKITKEDTWRPADLRRHIKEEQRGDDYVRRRDDKERRHRGGESIERHHRDSEKESRQEREKLRQKERRDEDQKDKYSEQRKEGSRDRRGDKDRDRERRRERDRVLDDHRENRDKRQDGEEKHDRERDKDRERVRDRTSHNEEDRNKRREDRDKARRREERDREHRSEKDRKRHEESGEERRQEIEKHHRGQRDQHRERQQHKNDNENMTHGEIQERRGDRKHSERRGEEREYKEERQKHKEEREGRHKERGHYDEKWKHESESREHLDVRGAGEGVRYHHGDRERTDKESKDRRHRDKEDAEGKRKERRHRDEEDAERKHKEGRHRDEDDPERKRRERRHRDEEDAERKHKPGRRKDEEDAERKHKERRHKDEEDTERKHKERRHRDEEDAERKHKETTHKDEEDAERKHNERRHKDEEDTERKHKERGHRDEEDAEKNHGDRSTSKKSSSDKGHVPESNTVESEVANDEDLADQEYEDDFEDYEEDFEDVSASEAEDEKEPVQLEVGEKREELTAQRRKEIEAIQRAMDEENERAGTAQSGQSTNREEEDRPKDSEKNQSRTSQRGKFINFVAAKQREVNKTVATQQMKRSTDLLRLIDVDFSVTYSLLDLPPVSEYDLYIRNFGTANTKQAYVQCNEDNVERDIQTEEIELCEKWTQHPPENSGACGDPNLSQEARDNTISGMNFDSQRLISFLHSASQVMVVLLEEDQAERKSLRNLRTQTDTLSFSDGSLQLNTRLPFLIGRQVSLLHFSQVQRHTMLSVHMPTTKPSSVRLDSCTIICIWNIWEPSRPQRILVYESEVQCCCFSPGKAILVFAGTSVGSVVLWDLREHASNHYRLKIGEDEWTFRQPTFSTDAVMAGSGHFSSVTSVEVVPSALAEGLRSEVPLLASEEESSGLSFQLASLDESGVLNFWVVVELPKGNEAGSATDLGLWPGGKVKLLHSSSLLTAERVSPRDAVKRGPLQALLLKFLPTDSNHFFIGTNMGLVNHGTSHGLKAPPKFYRFQEAGLRPVDVSSIHFSPFKQHLFLVGCGNGSIRLHAVSHEQPVAEWKDATAGEAVVSLQWTQTRPTVFCVLDAASNIHIWDLLKNDTQPVVTERMDTDRVTAMAVFGDSGQQNTYSGIALAHQSEKIEMHYFTRNFTVCSCAEEEKLESIMKETF